MFITQPTNIDYLIDSVRFRLGDFTGSAYSTTLLRTALVAGVRFLQPKWSSKYLIFSDSIILDQQTTTSGYISVATPQGNADIYNDSGDGTPYENNDVFRNPYIEFLQTAGLFDAADEEAIVLAATYMVHVAKLTGNADTFVSWRTEDLSYSNLGGERVRQTLLKQIIDEINALFKSRIAKATVLSFPRIYRYPYEPFYP